MDSPPKVDLLEFRTQTEVDLDTALSELYSGDNNFLSKERKQFLTTEIDRLQKKEFNLRNENHFWLNGGEVVDLTLPVTTPPTKKRFRKPEFDERGLKKEIDSDSETVTTCPWSDESESAHSQQTSFENGFSFSNEVCRKCSAKLVTEDSSKGKQFKTCPYSALRDKNDVKIKDGKGKVIYDKSHTFYWTGRK